MAYMIALGFGILFVVLMGDLYERHLNHKDVDEERLITTEEDDLEKDYLVMKDGTLVEYNEDDQE